MIVAAPSLHSSGNRYTWDEGCSPFEIKAADMPSWLVEEIRKVGTAFTAKKTVTDNTPRKKITEGGRNNHLASLAGSLRRKGVSEEGIIATLRAENEKQLDPPLDDETVLTIAKSVMRSALWQCSKIASNTAPYTKNGLSGTANAGSRMTQARL